MFFMFVYRYIVERKSKESDRWLKVTREPVMSFSFRINGLYKDKYYAFRVITENKAGYSAPSTATDYVKMCLPLSIF